MSLLFQVLGVLAGAVALAALTGFSSPASARTGLGRGVAIVAVAAASLLFWTQVWPAVRGFDSNRRANREMDKGRATRMPAEGSADLSFLDWANAHMGAGQSFFLEPNGADNSFIYQWSTYQLLPHRHRPPAQADWLVFYNVNPQNVQYDRAQFAPPQMYGQNFAIAERLHAG